MTYLTGDIPVGFYNSSNLANVGIGHGALDGGVGYTYFDPKTGHEFSVVSGTDRKLRKSIDQLYQRHRLAPRLGCIAVSDQTSASRLGRLRVRSGHARPRLRADHLPVPIPCYRYWPADWIYFSCGRHAGLPQSEGLRRVRQRESPGRLERVAYVCLVACGTRSRAAGDGDQSTASQLTLALRRITPTPTKQTAQTQPLIGESARRSESTSPAVCEATPTRRRRGLRRSIGKSPSPCPCRRSLS
jgi:hypothetical protein